MIGRLRVPLCFLMRRPYSEPVVKFDLFTSEKIKKNWSVIPLLLLKTFAIIGLPILCCHRLFVTTIDVQIPPGNRRFEITSPPGFFDLRNPRILKIIKRHKLKPAIHLDNRYRLMRNEPMLDADGNEIDQIGEDETAPPSPEETLAIMEEKGHDYFTMLLPRLKVTE
ncbi:uncharacterized protein [Bombus fervidus]|uniref:uncharacterized protein n=1 Tax=Bombus fervidus TaxID=203811 RepID=UPI003AB3162C